METRSAESDRQAGERIIEQGLARRGPVEECLSILDSLRRGGAAPLPELRELLPQGGHLSAAALDATVKLGRKPADPKGFELQDLLGQGGMGEVYRAREKNLNRDAAIKFIRESTPTIWRGSAGAR